MEAAANSNTKSPSPLRLRLLQLLMTLSSPVAASRVIAKGGKNKRVQLQVDAGDGAFECRTCNRRFSTFQALGGHRTSHKRPRVRAHGLDLLLGARPGKTSTPVTHRCGTCGQTFTTGQALGGHMRRHRPVSGGGAVATDQASTSSSSPSSGLSYQPDEDAWPTLIQFI